LHALRLILTDASPERLKWRPVSGKWSAHENLAHVARYHQIMLDRLTRLLEEDRPSFARYSADDDPEWPTWVSLTTEEVLRRLKALRGDLMRRVESLSERDLGRSAVHPAFGDMTTTAWLEFFLLHEAHHLYVAMTRIAEARKAS
jgi:uncharacterized damage-inducible protein DinB